VDKFPGFDGQIDRKIWTETVQIPEQVYSVDGKRFIHVNLVSVQLSHLEPR